MLPHADRMDLSTCRYIVIEGPIGAGKTSLARELAHRLHADELLEQPDDNPFLARFYDDMARFALPTQLTFLFQRVDQLRGLAQLDMFRRPTVADFLLDKDPLFARINLTDDEYALYEKVFAHLKPQTPTPDLVVYLQAPTEVLERRLRRDRTPDPNDEPRVPDPSPDYVKELNEAYQHFFFHYTATPLLVVETSEVDLTGSDDALDELLRQMASMTRGTRYYVPRP